MTAYIGRHRQRPKTDDEFFTELATTVPPYQPEPRVEPRRTLTLRLVRAAEPARIPLYTQDGVQRLQALRERVADDQEKRHG